MCRSYKRDIVMKDGQQTGGDAGLVCRTPDGDWQAVS
jgi:surface antigen